MDKLRAMQTFVAIVDSGTLSKAAGVLGSSLPSTVRTLATLEADLGVRLLNRTTRRLSLTDEGRMYLASCRDILGAIDQAEHRLRARREEPSGLLTMTAPVLFGQRHVAPALIPFLERFPKVQCRLLLLDRVVNLLEEGVDVGIRIGHLDDSNLIAQQVSRVSRVVVASPAYLERRGIPQKPADLAHENCIRFSGSGRTTWLFQERGREQRIAIGGNLECNHGAPAIDACVAGLGVGQFLRYQVASQLAGGQLQEILHAYKVPPLPISVVYPHAGLLPSRISAFVDWIKTEFRKSENDFVGDA
ncbi:LysR family transcriptional regulator [Ralstonia mannitolilytica]|uniref:LysR family transcriptional regulator n=1 Tax=Ralstonia mannitolilytica TaxID=105219 RepID=UPI0028F55F53|nr:LysR family transcriptional regulator [Ralstonia mannitolilytica]CAJ0737095.1 HTH-type transcriptional regulator DmlR [Ralstonia mannitolilytica]